MSGPTRGIKGFMDRLSKLQLEGKKFIIFDHIWGKRLRKCGENAKNLEKIATQLKSG